MQLLLHKKSKRSKDGPATSTPKTRRHSGSDRSVTVSSARSTPGQSTDKLLYSHASDTGNHTEPLRSPPSSRHSSPSRRGIGRRQRAYLTPEISKVRSRHSKGIFSVKRDSTANSSDEEHIYDDESDGHTPARLAVTPESNLAVPTQPLDESSYADLMPMVKLPLANNPATATGSQHSFHSHSPQLTVTRTASKANIHEQHSDTGSKDQLESHHSNSGFLSSFMSAAHTAATHIGSISNAGKHGPEVKFHETGTSPHHTTNDDHVTKNPESQGNGGSFIQHLDSLLFQNGKKQHQNVSPNITPPNLEEEEDGLVDNASATSLAHGVKFQPLRKTIVGTMGKGELTLEDLGFADMSTAPSVNGVPAASTPGNAPHIEVHQPTPHSPRALSPQMTPEQFPRASSPKIEFHKNVGQPPLKPIASATQLERAGSVEQRQLRASRSISPAGNLKHSLSPTISRQGDAYKRPGPSRSQSAHTDRTSLNGDISFGTPLSQESSIDLKNVTFAPEKRNADFHSTFKKIPRSERLIDDYSCALQREIMVQGRVLNEKMLVQGRLYISEHHISFKSNILGWVTTLNIPIQEIVQLEKKNTAVMFPNAIVVKTLHQKYNFASLLTRDATFDLITNIWNQIAPLPKIHNLLFGKDTTFMTSLIGKQKNKNISKLTPFADKDGTPTREYHYTKPLSAPVGPKETICNVVETLDHVDLQNYVRCIQTTKTPDVPSGNAFSVVTYIYLSWGPKNSTKLTVYTYMNWTGKSWIRTAIDRGSIEGQKESIAIMAQELKAAVQTAPTNSSSSSSPDEDFVSKLPHTGPRTHAAVNFTPTVPSPESIITEDTIQVPLGTAYPLLFSPTYLKQILIAQKVQSISNIPAFPEEGTKKRSYTYVMPLSAPVGPKSTKCIVNESIEEFDLNSHIHVVRTVNTPDVPSGGSFTVSSNYWLSWGENNTTKIVVSTGVIWTGKSWIKSVVEKNSIEGQKDSNKIMIEEAKNIIAKDAAEGGKKGGRKRGKTIKQKSSDQTDHHDKFLAEIANPKKTYDFGGMPWLTDWFQGGSINNVFIVFLFAFTIFSAVIYFNVHHSNSNSIANSTQGLTLGSGAKVMIDGREYVLVPSVDAALTDEKVKSAKEYEIWDWIESRSGKKASGPVGHDEKTSRRMSDVMKSHKEQDLKEMLHIVESHLEELLQVDEQQSDT
ncbi:GRAM domain-containing protein YSP2 [Cyberlindnera fabianii]|uniref:GRAM domain-containing protein YSP2 n=1 Tax=Cyberlindnera fabianii TaxID=36022 RepID=A0A1V2L694_CYBFA|nr:GRAM domain-containing protein YSP2 [Cyberlindnera fabianii]